MTNHGRYIITRLFLIETGSLYELLLLGDFPIALIKNFLDGEVIQGSSYPIFSSLSAQISDLHHNVNVLLVYSCSPWLHPSKEFYPQIFWTSDLFSSVFWRTWADTGVCKGVVKIMENGIKAKYEINKSMMWRLMNNVNLVVIMILDSWRIKGLLRLGY